MTAPIDRISQTGAYREIITTNLEALAQYQKNKNRRYMQLKPGKPSAVYMDAFLGKVQIFHEKIQVGARIEATPSDTIIPFGFVLDWHEYNFCNQRGENNAFVQATGGVWDISFKNSLTYIGGAFEREYFQQSYQAFTDKDIPPTNLTSKLLFSNPETLQEYARTLKTVLQAVRNQPFLDDKLATIVCSEIFKATFDVIRPESKSSRKLKTLPRRIKGAKKVIDYIHNYAHNLPDLQTLCQVANLSERSLQYGFMEYLGMSPIHYLRIVRLNRVRIELLSAPVHQTRISDVALKWGFLELGRFSRDYKMLFQELPSQTLRTQHSVVYKNTTLHN